MRYMMCKKCNTVFINNFLKPTTNEHVAKHCPIVGCPSELFEIDEMMIPVIQGLIKKGIHTEFCCSGHYGMNETTYIKFTAIPIGKQYPFELSDTVKEYFDIEDDKYPIINGKVVSKEKYLSMTIRRKFDIHQSNNQYSTAGVFMDIIRSISVLCDWIETLEPVTGFYEYIENLD